MAKFLLNSWNTSRYNMRDLQLKLIVYNDETKSIEVVDYVAPTAADANCIGISNVFPKLTIQVLEAARLLLQNALFSKIKRDKLLSIEKPKFVKCGQKVVFNKAHSNPFRVITETDCRYCKGTGQFVRRDYAYNKTTKLPCIKCHGTGDFNKVGKRLKNEDGKGEYFNIPVLSSGVVVWTKTKKSRVNRKLVSKYLVKVRLDDGTLVNAPIEKLSLVENMLSDEEIKVVASMASYDHNYSSLFNISPAGTFTNHAVSFMTKMNYKLLPTRY